MKKSYDAIVIGAGVVGLIQAVALTQKGFSVALVDRSKKISPDASIHFDPRVFALNRHSQHILERLGIWGEILRYNYSTYKTVALAFGSSKIDLTFDAQKEHEPDLGHVVEQTILRMASFERLEEFDSCDYYWEHELEAIQLDPPQVSLRDAASEKTCTLHAEIIIAADGIHSKARALCDISMDIFPCDQQAHVFNIQLEKTHADEARQYFSKEGIIAFLPLPHAFAYNIVWSCDEQHFDALEDHADVLEQVCGKVFGKITLASSIQKFPLRQQQASTYVKPGFACIGDAAHVIHPLAGQGANLGISDIEKLMERLLWARDSHRSLGGLSALNPYARARRSAAWQSLILMDQLQKIPNHNSWMRPCAQTLQKSSWLKTCLCAFALYDFNK